MSNPSIIFDNVSKSFLKGTGVSTSLIEAVYKGSRKIINKLYNGNEQEKDQCFWALKDISFEVGQGEAFAIIGPNGAGKSTALKILSKVSQPTKGRVVANGKMACLIELGAGFHPELTGRENIYLYGTIMGMTQGEIKKCFDEILDFSGISKFLDTPLKRYSSGMHARLGFSVAIHTRPDILLVDEVLAVGDWAFQQKCYAEMEKYRKRGTTIILVSHNMDAITKVCDKGLVLNKGKIEIIGSSHEIAGRYLADAAFRSRGVLQDDGCKHVILEGVQIFDGKGNKKAGFQSDEAVCLTARFKIVEWTGPWIFGLSVTRPDNLLVFSAPVAWQETKPHTTSIILKIEFNIKLLRGDYFLGVWVTSKDLTKVYEQDATAVPIVIIEKYAHGGIVDLRPKAVLLEED
ncbi:MAG: ABC transporter ATP-binding protein [Candidatus Scalindua sp.]